MRQPSTGIGIYGLMAEFKEPEAIVDAANHVREAGYKYMDAYSPMPVHGLAEAVGFKDNRVPWIIFFCGLAGMCAGYALCWWTSAVDYPINVGGRPFHSWPAFMPITFETTILFSAFGAFLGMLGLNGLPRPYHPVFNAPRFELASQDRFFLCVEARDPKFNIEETRQLLESLGAVNVSVVDP